MGEFYTRAKPYGHHGTDRKQMHYSPNLLSTVNNAIDNHKILTIEYDSHEKGITIRDVEPMAVVYRDKKRHLVGYCRLRNDFRNFRLDRLSTVRLMNEAFVPRTDFDVNQFQDTNGHGVEEYGDET